jgi:hypothetical protein
MSGYTLEDLRRALEAADRDLADFYNLRVQPAGADWAERERVLLSIRGWLAGMLTDEGWTGRGRP